MNFGPTPDLVQSASYCSAQQAGLDTCGLAQLASRTVGVPFVGLIAGSLAIAEPLRRLHGSPGLEMLSGSALSLPDVESCTLTAEPYAFGHVTVDGEGQ